MVGDREGQMTVRKMPLLLVVAVALIDRDGGKILLTQRPAHKQFAGQWEFPGGKMEANESPEHALIRECDEELGIKIDPANMAAISFISRSYDDFHLLMPFYAAWDWQGAVSGREGQNLRWLAPSELTDFPILEADFPLMPPLLAFCERFMAT